MKTLKWFNFLTLLVTVIVNGLANVLPINGQNTGQISDSYPVLFTPAGYVFSIWGLIYLALIGFAVYQALPSQANNPNLDKIGLWFSLSNLFNAGWIFAWHYRVLWLSELLMIGLLASLLIIYTRLQIGKTRVSPVEGLFTRFPFSLYLGWISVATIANTSVLLFAAGWNGFQLSPEFWTVLVIAVGAALGITMIRLRHEFVYPFVIIWAFAGIQLKPSSPELVATSAGIAAGLLLLVLVFSMLQARQRAMLEARKDRPNLT
jgi:benzodiazapine receptor